jgi:hypothetical protein
VRLHSTSSTGVTVLMLWTPVHVNNCEQLAQSGRVRAETALEPRAGRLSRPSCRLDPWQRRHHASFDPTHVSAMTDAISPTSNALMRSSIDSARFHRIHSSVSREPSGNPKRQSGRRRAKVGPNRRPHAVAAQSSMRPSARRQHCEQPAQSGKGEFHRFVGGGTKPLRTAVGSSSSPLLATQSGVGPHTWDHTERPAIPRRASSGAVCDATNR